MNKKSILITGGTGSLQKIRRTFIKKVQKN